MKEIKELFNELYREVFKISLLHAVTDSLIALFVAINLTALIGVSFVYAFILAFAFLLADLAYRMRRTTLQRIEAANPDIRDILSTARDNANQSSFMVLAMFEDLIRRMRNVSSASLLEGRGLVVKVLVMCALSFSVIMIAAYDLHVPKSVFDPDTYAKMFSKPGKEPLKFYTIDFNESSDIYGDPELAGLGNKEIEIQINPSVNEIGFDTVKEPEEKEFERGAFPEEVYAQTDAASEEKLPKESRIAIAYNLKLKEEGGEDD